MANVMPTMKSCIIFASFANFYYFCYIALYKTRRSMHAYATLIYFTQKKI